MYLIVGIILSVALPYLMAKSSRIYAFGIVFIVGGSLLAAYYYFHEPVKLEDYHVTEITYQKVYFKESADKIILQSNGKEYGLSQSVIDFYGQDNLKEIVRKLSLSSKAKVWLDDKNFIMGIESENFNMPPEVGVEYDNKTIKGMVKTGWIPAVFGLIAIVANFVTNYFQRIVDADSRSKSKI